MKNRDDLRQKLEAKGWDEEYIEKTIRILEKEDENKSLLQRLNSVVYWVALVICIFGNFVITIILIPFLITITNKVALGIIIGCIAISFGFLFNVLLSDIEDLDSNHHIIPGLFIPALSMINIFIMVNVANNQISILNLNNIHSPLIISIIYVVSFSAPYFISKIIKKTKELTIKKSVTNIAKQ